MITARTLTKQFSIDLLQASLTRQGLRDMSVIGLSEDYKTAVIRYKNQTLICCAELCLPVEEESK